MTSEYLKTFLQLTALSLINALIVIAVIMYKAGAPAEDEPRGIILLFLIFLTISFLLVILGYATLLAFLKIARGLNFRYCLYASGALAFTFYAVLVNLTPLGWVSVEMCWAVFCGFDYIMAIGNVFALIVIYRQKSMHLS